MTRLQHVLPLLPDTTMGTDEVKDEEVGDADEADVVVADDADVMALDLLGEADETGPLALLLLL